MQLQMQWKKWFSDIYNQFIYIFERKSKRKGGKDMAILKDKKVVIIGDRDGIPGPAIAECAKSAGAEVVFSSTECFV